jgi:hypothetical protein
VALVPSSSRGGGGSASDIAAVLAEGDDAAGAGIANLGDTTLQGSVIADGDNERYFRGPGDEAAFSGGSAGCLYCGGENGDSGTPVGIYGGSAQAVDESTGEGTVASGITFGGLAASKFVANAGNDALAQHGRTTVITDNATGALGQTLVSDGLAALVYGTLGALKLDTHAAPADGDLAAGELRFWFDQTNGSAKLMVKAKQADGTVGAAAVALA